MERDRTVLQCRLAGLSAILGVLMIGTSFGINTGPPLGASDAQMIAFASTHFRQVMLGSWLQAVGPLLIMAFALTVVHLAGAMNRISGWLTLLGASVLMMVSLAEVIFYICALDAVPASMGQIGNNIGHAIQHLYFIVAAPAVFFPLGAVLSRGRVLPRAFSILAFILGGGFFLIGIRSLSQPILSNAETSFAAIQALWWMAAAIALIARARRIARPELMEEGALTRR
jgi:hypothetical protein